MKPVNQQVSVTILAVGLALAATVASAADRPQPLPGQHEAVENSLLLCPTSIERSLPGVYYFCEASRDYWLGKQDMALINLRDSARWGNKAAQYALGISYFNGQRVPQDRPLGLAWLALASERHDQRYEPSFVSAYRLASEDERARADVLWQQMKRDYADDIAAQRAKVRFERETRDMSYALNFGGYLYLAGFGQANMGYSPDPDVVSQGNRNPTLFGMAASYFYGWKDHVTVGDLQLVPLAEAVKREPLPSN